MTRRVVLVVLLSCISVALWAPDITRLLGNRMGTPGFTVGRGNVVIAVDPQSSAYRAGIRVGQRVDLMGTPLQSRILLIDANFQNLHPIQTFPVRLLAGRRAFTAFVTSDPETRADMATVLPRMLFEVILLAAGIALVLLRPSKATWGFYAFGAFGPGAPVNAIIWLGPPVYQIAMSIFVSTDFTLIEVGGAIIFALYVLVTPPIPAWRRIAEITTYAGAAAMAALAGWSIVSAAYYGSPLTALDNFLMVPGIAAAAAPPILLLITYATSPAALRERLRWVIFGFTVNFFVNSMYFFSQQTLAIIALPYWAWGILAGIDTFAVSFTVLYAVLKHHIIDINVAISRALVYTLLSAIVVGAFALVDLFFTRALSARNAGLIVDIALALFLGFFFNSLHFKIDRFVDRVLFRQRHAAEEHLRTVIRAMPFAVSEEQVDRLTVEEPTRSFTLTGAALFACTDSGEYDLRHTFGSSPPRFTLVSREDALPVYLQGERHALRLDKHGWNVPAIAIPLFSHGDLAAVVLYGLHENGTDLDTEEIALFEELATAAGNAYDRLEAKRLRDEVRELRLARV